jgi:hypothetical protein
VDAIGPQNVLVGPCEILILMSSRAWAKARLKPILLSSTERNVSDLMRANLWSRTERNVSDLMRAILWSKQERNVSDLMSLRERARLRAILWSRTVRMSWT